MSFGQPYRPQSNRIWERWKEGYQETLRILRTSIKTSNLVLWNDFAMVVMNNKLRGKSDVLRSELFLS